MKSLKDSRLVFITGRLDEISSALDHLSDYDCTVVGFRTIQEALENKSLASSTDLLIVDPTSFGNSETDHLGELKQGGYRCEIIVWLYALPELRETFASNDQVIHVLPSYMDFTMLYNKIFQLFSR
jgi:hypothetical protein